MPIPGSLATPGTAKGRGEGRPGRAIPPMPPIRLAPAAAAATAAAAAAAAAAVCSAKAACCCCCCCWCCISTSTARSWSLCCICICCRCISCWCSCCCWACICARICNRRCCCCCCWAKGLARAFLPPLAIALEAPAVNIGADAAPASAAASRERGELRNCTGLSGREKGGSRWEKGAVEKLAAEAGKPPAAEDGPCIAAEKGKGPAAAPAEIDTPGL